MRVGHKLEVTTGPEGTPRRQKVASFYTGNPAIALAMAWQNRPLWPAVASQVVGTLASLAEAVGQPWPDTPLAGNGQPWPLNTFWNHRPQPFFDVVLVFGDHRPQNGQKVYKGVFGWGGVARARPRSRPASIQGSQWHPDMGRKWRHGDPFGFSLPNFLAPTLFLVPFWTQKFTFLLPPLPTFGPPPATTPLFSQGSMS